MYDDVVGPKGETNQPELSSDLDMFLHQAPPGTLPYLAQYGSFGVLYLCPPIDVGLAIAKVGQGQPPRKSTVCWYTATNSESM